MMDAKIGSDASSHETQEGAAKKQAPQERDANSDDDSDDAPDPNENQGDSTEQNRLRREKRLAMNRESARARRKRKKILIETLEHQVAELTKSNKKYRIQVSELEKELVVAKQTIQILSRPGNPVAQQPSFSFNQGQQTSHILSSRRAEMEQNDVARRLLQTRNPSVAGQNIAVAGSNVPVTTTADQLLRLERLGVQNISQSVVSRQAPVSAAGTGIESLARPLGDVGTIFGIRGTQNMVRPECSYLNDHCLTTRYTHFCLSSSQESAGATADRISICR